MKIVIATDAWEPQTNGVVTTLKKTIHILQQRGHEVFCLNAQACRTFPLPGYADIRLAIFPYQHVKKQLDKIKPDVIHIATEGSIGIATRRYCLRNKLKFTTSYHTQFPQYVRLRIPVPVSWTYMLMRWFHSKAECTMVATPSMQQELRPWIKHIVTWTRGVDTDLFRPVSHPDGKEFFNFERPVFLYVGRVAVEKNIRTFLELELPGTMVVVGEGPDLHKLKHAYPGVIFTGLKKGQELVKHISAADVFVFPSETDTFGLVILEAMACGVPVAAYPVTGPGDIIEHGKTGYLSSNLEIAALKALELNADNCRNYALQHTWEDATDQFFGNLVANVDCQAYKLSTN